MTKTRPFGHWDSPLTAERLATDSITLHEVAVDVYDRPDFSRETALLTQCRTQQAPFTLSSAILLKMAATRSCSTLMEKAEMSCLEN